MAPLRLRENEPLAPRTTLELGGPARYFAEVTSLDEIEEAVRLARERGLRLAVLGGGSNLLVADQGFDGLVAAIASKSAGIGTRQNIDEFTQTTARSLEALGGAKKGKAIIVLNPAEPPIRMQNTIYALVQKTDPQPILDAVHAMVARIQSYVRGYRLKHEPAVDGEKVTVQITVEGAGDYLPTYAGNLDIITSAAVAVGEAFARKLTQRGKEGH